MVSNKKKMKWLRGFKDYKLTCKRITIALYAPGTSQIQDRVKTLDDARAYFEWAEVAWLKMWDENLVTRFWMNKFYSEKHDLTNRFTCYRLWNCAKVIWSDCCGN